MPAKPKQNYKQEESGVTEKDMFQTPNYATKLLLPYIPKDTKVVWECAAGDGKIANILENSGYKVFRSDVKQTEFPIKNDIVNFLDQLTYTPLRLRYSVSYPQFRKDMSIITNPPFSKKIKFLEKCLEYNVPFALLIPFDMADWLWSGFKNQGLQGIVPRRRINYITPNMPLVVYKGELKRTIEKATGLKWKKFDDIPQNYIDMYGYSVPKYHEMTIDELPKELIAKYSASQFHSFWLTKGFDFRWQFEWVELTREMMKDV